MERLQWRVGLDVVELKDSQEMEECGGMIIYEHIYERL
jgi:hypothetical protein